MRLDKFLANQGIGSRSQVKQYIKKGLVQINGIPCRQADRQINENEDRISCDGTPVDYQKFHYYMLNKPAGCVSATQDNVHTTVLDLLQPHVRTTKLFPVGRLDIDTEGLLLITDDGALSHRLLSPAHHVDKTYFARINGIVTDAHITAFASGIDIGDDTLTRPGTLVIQTIDEDHQTSDILLTITEGRFHQVKRSFASLGLSVTYLKRLTMGALTLDSSLAPGEFRVLTEDEIRAIAT